MPKVRYGNRILEYELSIEPQLKNTYLQVEQGKPVLYRTPRSISEKESNREVLKKAQWLIRKLALVAEPHNETLRTGSRIPYLGKRYYAELKPSTQETIVFNSSKFSIAHTTSTDLDQLLEVFYKNKSIEKIKPRFARWIKLTGLQPTDIKFRKLDKRWGSCTANDTIVISTEAIKLPWQLIDYLIVHELCHIKHKDHTKEFWKEVEKWKSDFRELDNQMDTYEL